MNIIPVVLFAYSRPYHLRRTLYCLQQNNVPFIYAFADGPKTTDVAERVSEVRHILHNIDWCKVYLVERKENLGLGKSILSGVTEVFQKYDTIIVFEDDMICVPGTYDYLCAALQHYKDSPNVMSVTGWTHPRTTPKDIITQPYFDGRAESWSWGTWARVWQRMDQDAQTMIISCQIEGININRYGADLPEMAKIEEQRNIWAVRFLYWHIVNHGLCLRPPWSMVEHIGFDELATNASDGSEWSNPPLKPCPPIPGAWPEPVEHLDCGKLWQKAYPKSKIHRIFWNYSRRIINKARSI